MQIPLTQATIRPYNPADAPSIARYLDNERISCNLTRIPYPYTLAHAVEWIGIASSHTPQTFFGIALNGEAIGGIGIRPADPATHPSEAPSAEIGYWLAEPFWGRGIMTEAVIALTKWAFTELRLVRLQAAVFARNPASARVLAKAGYAFEGRLQAKYFRDGEFIDGLLYASVRLPR
jgi:RimJ/RimL family protein N-acetyltransferase